MAWKSREWSKCILFWRWKKCTREMERDRQMEWWTEQDRNTPATIDLFSGEEGWKIFLKPLHEKNINSSLINIIYPSSYIIITHAQTHSEAHGHTHIFYFTCKHTHTHAHAGMRLNISEFGCVHICVCMCVCVCEVVIQTPSALICLSHKSTDGRKHMSHLTVFLYSCT